jgi:hypothetical protein
VRRHPGPLGVGHGSLFRRQDQLRRKRLCSGGAPVRRGPAAAARRRRDRGVSRPRPDG